MNALQALDVGQAIRRLTKFAAACGVPGVPIDLGLLVADRKRLMNEAAAAESDRARAAGYLLLIRAAEDLRTAIQAWDRELRIDSFSEAAKEAGDALTNAQRVVLDTAAVPPAGDTTRKRAGR